MTVTARNDAGNTALSSDGFVVIGNNTDLSGITVQDGEQCGSVGTESEQNYEHLQVTTWLSVHVEDR